MNISNIHVDRTFENVSVWLYDERHIPVEKFVEISFIANDITELFFTIYKKKGKWYPGKVCHNDWTDNNFRCCFCGSQKNNYDKNCYYFEDKASSLFAIMMKEPSIRLEKLFW
jgi:hypothetical protein